MENKTVSIRLRGLHDDVEKAKKVIEENFDITRSSAHNYLDRGNSNFVRAYMDAEFKDGQLTDQDNADNKAGYITEDAIMRAYNQSKKENLT